jgi:tRNA threonylcarbamoyladenosine biosynthesis protein TsaB
VITLALDTATDRCGVAATDGTRVVSRYLDGARRHNAAILGLVGELLAELGASPRDVTRVLTANGPGSFTGLRVSTAVAKALAWGRSEVSWAVAPSLLARAAAHVPAGGGVVLALSDALRGDLYAGAWRFTGNEVTEVQAPRAMAPDQLPEGVDCVVGSVPEALRAAVRLRTGHEPIVGDAALPDTVQLLRLDRLAGGTRPIEDPVAWEPEYGRPAEAQAVWERNHGRPLPAPADRLD